MSIFNIFRRHKNDILQDSGGTPEAPEISINESTALSVSAVYACVKLISDSIATLPLNVYEHTKDGKIKAKNHDLYQLLKISPNLSMTAVDLMQTVLMNLVLHGNGYIHLKKDNRGRIIAMYPLSALQVEVLVNKDSGQLEYYYIKKDKPLRINNEDLVHIKNIGNGITGISPIAMAGNSLKHAIHAEQYATKFFRNGGKPLGIVRTTETLKGDQRQKIRENIYQMINDIDNKKIMVLEAGFEYAQIQISPEDIQLIAQRRFQIEDICRFFGVPTVMINENSVSTNLGSSTEIIMQNFFKTTISPLLKRIEDSMLKTMIDRKDWDKYSIEFNFEGLLRGDSKTRAEFYKTMYYMGAMSTNEIRAKENMNSIKNGDTHVAQLNLTDIQNIGKDVNNQ